MSRFRLNLIKEVKELATNLMVGLRDISFADNFTSFEYQGVIPANTEVKVRNTLTIRPSRYIITHQTGNALVTAGPTLWDDNFLYLKNHDGSNSATVIVTFMR